MTDIDGNLLPLDFNNSSANRELPGSLLMESSGAGIATDDVSVVVHGRQAIDRGSFQTGFAGSIEPVAGTTTVQINAHPIFGLTKIDVVVHVEDLNEQITTVTQEPHHFGCLLDGNNERAVVNNATAFQLERTNPFSMSFWFMSLATVFQLIMGKTQGIVVNANIRGYDTYITPIGEIGFNLNSNFQVGGNYIEIQTDETHFNDGALHHGVVTYNGSSSATGQKIYIDGTLRATHINQNTLTTTIQNSANLTIGDQSVNLGGPFNGILDECALFNAELTAAHVLELYNNGCPTNILTLTCAPFCVGWWQMGDGAVFPIIPDASLNNNPATLTNMEAADIVGVTYPGCA